MKKYNQDKLIWEDYKDKNNDQVNPTNEDLKILELKTQKIPHIITSEGVFVEDDVYDQYLKEK